MKTSSTLTTIAAVLLAVIAKPALAQHGPGTPMMSHGPRSRSMSTNHGNMTPHPAAKLSGKSANDLLQQNTKLAARLEKLLPNMTGNSATDLQTLLTDANGFKNLGQFVAAVHVASNLGIGFDQLKAKMIGPPPESLGEAIKELKPAANASAAAKKANNQAKTDLDSSTAGS
jgi:hypothetical protein